MRRDYSSIAVSKSFKPHFNHSVGKYVRNNAEFRSELSRASDRASERTGIDHNYKPIDAGDRPGVTSEGLYETEKRKRDDGITQPTRRHFT